MIKFIYTSNILVFIVFLCSQPFKYLFCVICLIIFQLRHFQKNILLMMKIVVNKCIKKHLDIFGSVYFIVTLSLCNCRKNALMHEERTTKSLLKYLYSDFSFDKRGALSSDHKKYVLYFILDCILLFFAFFAES